MGRSRLFRYGKSGYRTVGNRLDGPPIWEISAKECRLPNPRTELICNGLGRAIAVMVTIKPLTLTRCLFLGVLLLGVSLSGGFLVSTAEAAKLPGPPKKMIRNMDADGDGRISAQEWRKKPKFFKKIDRDKDGFVTLEELQLYKKAGAGAGGGQKSAGGQKQGGKAKVCMFENTVASNGAYIIEIYSPNCAYQGTTLFADTTNPQYSKIVEVDMRGKTVWELPLYKLFGKLKKDSKPHSVERLKNGNTLFTVRQLGVFEVNPSGKLVWQYNDSGFFLDADRLANGNTLVVKARVAKGKAHVLEIAPDKKVVWSWNGLAQYDRPPYSGIEFDGWMHANAVTRMANGNTWVSLRNFDIFAEIDKQGNVVTEIKLPVPGTKIPSKIAANQKKIYRGKGPMPVARPHDPEIQANGNLLIPHTGVAGMLVETDPKGQRQLWQKIWLPDTGIYVIRDANRLPNGNILITSGIRLLEISPDKQVVWQMKLAKAGEKKGKRIDLAHMLYKAIRIAPDGTAFGG